jgi:hypothetical protein
MLQCEQNTPETKQAVSAAFTALYGGTGTPQISYEHGQWWVVILETGEIFSVVDVEFPCGTESFAFEEV